MKREKRISRVAKVLGSSSWSKAGTKSREQLSPTQLQESVTRAANARWGNISTDARSHINKGIK